MFRAFRRDQRPGRSHRARGQGYEPANGRCATPTGLEGVFYENTLGLLAAFSLGIALTVVATGALNRPATFEECMTRSLKGVPNNEPAIGVIARACRAKFPWQAQPGTETRAFNSLELVYLTGRAGLEYGNRFGGDLYNGTANTTVNEVEIEVRAIRGRDTTARTYRTSVRISPRATSHFGFDIIVGEQRSKYEWDIKNAWGYSTDH